MRFDVVFYDIGITCFVLAILIIRFWGATLIPTALMIVLLLFGLFFVASGYVARPKKYKIMPPIKPIETEEPMKKPEEEPAQQPRQPIKPSTELGRTGGIGPKG